MDVTYEDVKVLHRNNDDRVHEAEFAWITDRTEFDYVQININVENLSEEHVNFNPIAQIVTNSGQQIDYFDAEFVQYYSNAEVAGEFREGVKKDGFMAFILPENFDVDELEWLRFYTNDVFSEDTFETLAGEEEIEINF
ncbi:hypothetical protein JCM19037_1634 [Geomicrobium sp. JCM 19037]|uniref:DUF4352 domain-containing protein n=1 Tax=Geomicrobium sp. JCM 19037 TaxID=1460634 RepID=UPI00045F1567|nr:DUF4352 domain-containing protein [Geomicrobium sp. JCM 19037]GAK03318.1 hypothetical protein JCM19037_1634 [Geomicrobium sp. JCM 19037]